MSGSTASGGPGGTSTEASQGRLAGGIAGGLIGAYFGMPGVGYMLGDMVGGQIGGAVGGEGKKGETHDTDTANQYIGTAANVGGMGMGMSGMGGGMAGASGGGKGGGGLMDMFGGGSTMGSGYSGGVGGASDILNTGGSGVTGMGGTGDMGGLVSLDNGAGSGFGASGPYTGSADPTNSINSAPNSMMPGLGGILNQLGQGTSLGGGNKAPTPPQYAAAAPTTHPAPEQPLNPSALQFMQKIASPTFKTSGGTSGNLQLAALIKALAGRA